MRALLCILMVGPMVFAACDGGDDAPPPDPVLEVVHVSPEGSDEASGARETPFRTLERALSSEATEIRMLAGEHVGGPFRVERPVSIVGEDARIVGRLLLSADRIGIEQLWVFGGLEAIFCADLSVRSTTVSAVLPNTVRLEESTGSLSDLHLDCGEESCLLVEGSTVAVTRLTASGEALRVVSVRGGQVDLEEVHLRGGSISTLQLAATSATVNVATLAGGDNGLVILERAEVLATDVAITETRETSLLVNRANVQVRGGRFAATNALTVGVAGGQAALEALTLFASPLGAISVSKSFGERGMVRMEGGLLEHGTLSGLLVSEGDATVDGTRFVGSSEPGDDAVIGSGPQTTIDILGASFDRPSGYAVGLYGGASGAISATIDRPVLGGLRVEDPDGPVVVSDTAVMGCGTGSGLELLGAETTVDRLSVEGCIEAGVNLLGGTATISASRLVDNGQFGIGAFSGGRVFLRTSTISGSPFATFATCGDGARVDIDAASQISGTVTDCP